MPHAPALLRLGGGFDDVESPQAKGGIILPTEVQCTAEREHLCGRHSPTPSAGTGNPSSSTNGSWSWSRMGWINQHLNPSVCIAAIVLMHFHVDHFKVPLETSRGAIGQPYCVHAFHRLHCVSSGETRLCLPDPPLVAVKDDSVVCRPSLGRASAYAHGWTRQSRCMQACSCQHITTAPVCLP